MNQTAMRAPFLTRLLARWGRHYLWRVTLAFQLASFLAASLGIYYIVLNAGLYEGQFARLAEAVFGLVGIANLLVFLYGFVITPKARIRLTAWAQAQKAKTTLIPQPEQEEAAWRETTAYPWRFTRFSVLTSFFQVIVPAALYLYWTGGFSLSQSIHGLIGGIISASGLLLFYYFALEWALEPVRAVLLPSDAERQHGGLGGARLQSRLLMVFLAIGVTALLMVSALTYQKALDLTAPGADTAAILRNLQTQLAGVGLAALTFTIGFSYLLARSVSTPINRLRAAMSNVERGQLDQRAEVTSTDEVGHLGIAFNTMMAQLEILQTHTEQLVAERTQNLESRTNQLRAAVHVARQAAEIRDLGPLLNDTAQLISNQFGFYHAGIFLLDEGRQYAILQAASSQGGAQMLARGYRLQVNAQGIVGDAAAQGKPRIALNAGADIVLFSNPDLPLTRSEIALPLIVRKQVVGVLDIQSDQLQAFSEGDIDILQSMADQLALAIENIRLMAETQTSLAQLESLTVERVRRTWTETLGRQELAYAYTPLGTSHSSVHPLVEEGAREPDSQALQASITLHDQKIGVIKIKRKEQNWHPREQAMLEEIATQVGLALENARLLEETQARAHRDQMVAAVSTRMRATLNLETILQTAARELQRGLNLKEAEVRLGLPGPEKDATEKSEAKLPKRSEK